MYSCNVLNDRMFFPFRCCCQVALTSRARSTTAEECIRWTEPLQLFESGELRAAVVVVALALRRPGGLLLLTRASAAATRRRAASSQDTSSFSARIFFKPGHEVIHSGKRFASIKTNNATYSSIWCINYLIVRGVQPWYNAATFQWQLVFANTSSTYTSPDWRLGFLAEMQSTSTRYGSQDVDNGFARSIRHVFFFRPLLPPLVLPIVVILPNGQSHIRVIVFLNACIFN